MQGKGEELGKAQKMNEPRESQGDFMRESDHVRSKHTTRSDAVEPGQNGTKSIALESWSVICTKM